MTNLQKCVIINTESEGGRQRPRKPPSGKRIKKIKKFLKKLLTNDTKYVIINTESEREVTHHDNIKKLL